ncbi:hypothetical protein PoB_005464900 [Plakobranchus ocellatus]|uniref:Uncharacterized protein n=1 Tax=Plakobranchus ocellatus TaxID=259542 RepID=A0AAV4C6G4_9GAST|nr:hypothetical protein PoB_005464900 [Plakobranchus ocellatus]
MPKLHQAAKDATTTKSLLTFTSKPCQQDEKQLAINQAEVIMTELITELHLPISAADTLTKAFKAMFSDSQIVKDFACVRTKCRAIIKDLLKVHQSTLPSHMKISPFTLSTEGGNNCGNGKQFPIVIRQLVRTEKRFCQSCWLFPFFK